MFSIEEVRKNNRTRLLVSSFAAHIAAMAVVLMMVLGPSTAFGRAATNARELSRDGDNRLHSHPRLGPGSG